MTQPSGRWADAEHCRTPDEEPFICDFCFLLTAVFEFLLEQMLTLESRAKNVKIPTNKIASCFNE